MIKFKLNCLDELKALPILLLTLRLADSILGIECSRVQWSSSGLLLTRVSRFRSKLCRPAPSSDITPGTLGANSFSSMGGTRLHISNKCCGPICEYLRSCKFIKKWLSSFLNERFHLILACSQFHTVLRSSNSNT